MLLRFKAVCTQNIKILSLSSLFHFLSVLRKNVMHGAIKMAYSRIGPAIERGLLHLIDAIIDTVTVNNCQINFQCLIDRLKKYASHKLSNPPEKNVKLSASSSFAPYV